ncbi:MAG: helix-turn-helix transcriptional regulator [Bacilli bacterium]
MNKKYHFDLNENVVNNGTCNNFKSEEIEQGRKLEDIASGICSTSYLSRIENNQVKLQDPYLRMLFEKLDINYDDLKQERQTNYLY